MHRSRASRLAALAVVGALALAACSAEPDPVPRAAVETSDPDAVLTVAAGPSDHEAALETSRALFDASPLVVVAPAGDPSAQALAGQAAIALGVPVLVAPPARSGSASPAPGPLDDELSRLQATTALVVDGPSALDESFPALEIVRVDATAGAVGAATGATIDPPSADTSTLAAALAAVEAPASAEPESVSGGDDPDRARAAPTPGGTAIAAPGRAALLTDTVALAVDGVEQLAAIATARAAGVPVHLVPADSPEPVTHASVIDALHASSTTRTLAIGAALAAEPALDWQVRAARGGHQLPGGGQRVFDGRQFVALYGTPGAPVLGVLGEQGVDAAIERARAVAAPYAAMTDRTVVPMFEIIASVASAGPGDDGDYSNEIDPESLRPWVEAAGAAGLYVVLDLQPGRTDFLTQAQRYRSLLELPHVGLALDPEWRLEPDEVHLRQIGSVDAAEVNGVVTWLADLTNELGLPPKMLVLHQFRLDMLPDRAAIDLSRPELEVVVHVDGQGSPGAKLQTWATLLRDAPEGLHFGWKNFYDEDLLMLTPEQTIAQVSPTPALITYQ